MFTVLKKEFSVESDIFGEVWKVFKTYFSVESFMFFFPVENVFFWTDNVLTTEATKNFYLAGTRIQIQARKSRSPCSAEATHCNTLQHTETNCNTLKHTATHCNTLQHTLPYTLQHTATHCNNTLQCVGQNSGGFRFRYAGCCSVMQCDAM